MSRRPDYQRLLNSPRWRELKAYIWQRDRGLCQRCRREGIEAGVLPDGYVTPGTDCHHIRPVESARTPQEMEQLAFDPSNVELLCVPCHIRTHQEMRSHTREAVREARRLARERFLARNDPSHGAQGRG